MSFLLSCGEFGHWMALERELIQQLQNPFAQKSHGFRREKVGNDEVAITIEFSNVKG
jgi:hypothetical protein